MATADELAFLTLFESEPVLLDPNVPWSYNTATYTTEREGFLVTLQVSPSYSTLKVAIAVDGRETTEAELAAFKRLEIQMDNGSEMLVARFGESAASALFLTLRPHVRLSLVAGSDN